MQQRKYVYWLVIQGNFGAYGYEDVDHIDRHGDYMDKGNHISPYAYSKLQLGEHRLSCPSASYRIINRREKIA
jgi:hypothetical protein